MRLFFKTLNIIILAIIFFSGILLPHSICFSQLGTASTANWKYPDGNVNGTRYVSTRSDFQYADSLVIKWTTGDISGDVKPLIGNIVNNSSIRQGFSAPNEIVAVMGDRIVIIDGLGKLIANTKIPSQIVGVNDISCLLDTISTGSGTTQLLGLSTREVQTPDSTAHAYLAGYDHTTGKVKILKSLAIDLKDYDPNIFASIRPVYGKKSGGDFLVYADVNMSQPEADDPFPIAPPFYRGFAMFNIGDFEDVYPLPDNYDDINSRVTLGPEIPLIQPSIREAGGEVDVLMPMYPTPSLDVQVQNFVTFETAADTPYLIGFDISSPDVQEGVFFDVSPFMDNRPRVKPYYIDITDNNTGENSFILLAEEYSGIEGSDGTARLHLHETDFGDPLTGPPGDLIEPPLTGGQNHYWQVAVGNLDGNSINEWLPYFPNNTGKELIVTQSSEKFAVASSKLMVLKYNSGPGIEKPTGANEFLFPFDTICTERINGWVAAVNDIDGDGDNKDEILLVDGTRLMILRMRDYEDVDFRIGRPFDTVAVYTFKQQTISQVAVSDLEGDGKNDIIVTTFDSTYVLGTLIDDTIELLTLNQSDPIQEYCAGDTLSINWRNVIKGQQDVTVKFVPYINGSLNRDSTFILDSGISNIEDTISYKYPIGSELYSRTGKIRIESSARPEFIFDESELIRINPPVVDYVSPGMTTFYIGEEFNLEGNVSCIDSIVVEYFDAIDSVWTYLGSAPVFDDYYEFIGEFPCMDIFRCDTFDLVEYIDVRIIGVKAGISDTSVAIPIDVEPARFPVSIVTNDNADPTKYLTWDSDNFTYEIDSVYIGASYDDGETFRTIDIVEAASDAYNWYVPLDQPAPAILRICGLGSCMRSDTLLKDYRPRFINMIAPNPFRPPLEEANIIYKVPEATDVNIYVLDQNNAIAIELVKNAFRQANTAYTEIWDGYLDNGTFAANGLYYVVIELSNGDREVQPLFLRK